MRSELCINFGGFVTEFSVIISCIDVHVGLPVVASIHGNCQGSWNGDESCHRGGFRLLEPITWFPCSGFIFVEFFFNPEQYNVLQYQLDSLCFKLYDMIMIGDLRKLDQCFWKISFIASINFCNVGSARVWRRVWRSRVQALPIVLFP